MSHTSIMRKVAQAVVDSGTLTVVELEKLLPGYSRDQLDRALIHARVEGLIRLVKRGSGNKRVSNPGIWAGIDGVVVLPPTTRPVNSAFELGEKPQMPGGWPPRSIQGRQYVPLGPWNEEANDNERSAA